MASVTTTKPICLDQLDDDTGGHGLNGGSADAMRADGVEKTVSTVEGSPVTQAQLEAAVAAHVAVFPVTLEEQIAALQAQVAALTTQVQGL